MYNTHIVDIITKIATQNPEIRQELIDLATLGYREGLIKGKLNVIAEDEEMDPSEINPDDLLEDDVVAITEDTENWFRELMELNAKAMLNSHNSDEVNGGREYMRRMRQNLNDSVDMRSNDNMIRLNKINLGQFIENFMNLKNNVAPPSRNRVKADMDKLIEENPDLFE
jgi:hypothetical protein